MTDKNLNEQQQENFPLSQIDKHQSKLDDKTNSRGYASPVKSSGTTTGRVEENMKVNYIPFWMWIPLMLMPVDVSVDIEGSVITKCVYKRFMGRMYVLKIETLNAR